MIQSYSGAIPPQSCSQWDGERMGQGNNGLINEGKRVEKEQDLQCKGNNYLLQAVQ